MFLHFVLKMATN